MPQFWDQCYSSLKSFFVSQLCFPVYFFSLAHVASTILNKDNDLSPVNIYKISKGINFIDFYPLAHIWSSHCGQRLKDLHLALSLADLSVETENPLHTWSWRVVPPRVPPEGWRTRDSDGVEGMKGVE